MRGDGILDDHYFIVNIKRDWETILPKIIQEIELEITIYLDEWKAYSMLKIHDFFHWTVNHSKYFIGATNKY